MDSTRRRFAVEKGCQNGSSSTKGVTNLRDAVICRWNTTPASAPHALEDDTRAVMNDHPNPRAATARAIVTIM